MFAQRSEAARSAMLSPLSGYGLNPMSPYLTVLGKPMAKKERRYARDHAIFLVRNLDKLRHKLTKPPEERKAGREEGFVKGTHFTKRGLCC